MEEQDMKLLEELKELTSQLAEFETDDLVLALQKGAYEAGPRAHSVAV
jgi:hypothetical protein